MTAEKWKLVRGSVYKLAEVFEGMTDAVTLAREMKEKHHVFLSKIKDGRWAVYWRIKESTFEYEPKYNNRV